MIPQTIYIDINRDGRLDPITFDHTAKRDAHTFTASAPGLGFDKTVTMDSKTLGTLEAAKQPVFKIEGTLNPGQTTSQQLSIY